MEILSIAKSLFFSVIIILVSAKNEVLHQCMSWMQGKAKQFPICTGIRMLHNCTLVYLFIFPDQLIIWVVNIDRIEPEIGRLNQTLNDLVGLVGYRRQE